MGKTFRKNDGRRPKWEKNKKHKKRYESDDESNKRRNFDYDPYRSDAEY